MTPEHVWELVAILAGAALAWLSRRSENREQAERAAREAQAARLGERIGSLERSRDWEEGRRAGLEEARKGHGG